MMCAVPARRSRSSLGLRQRQASPGGAIAFWLGNSVLNPATLVFMGFVLGWNWTVLRLVLGLWMVFGLGYLVNRMVTTKEAEAAQAQLARLAEADAGVSSAFTALAAGFSRRMAARLIRRNISC